MATTDIVAILFTDLVGSTEAVVALGDEAAEGLRRVHFDLVRRAIADHGGTEVKNLGDGFMVAFGAASDAVAGATAIQQAVARHTRRGEGPPLAVRMGLAVGEVTCDEGDYFGTPVIEASRLCERAGGGQILVTDMVRALAGSRGGQRFEPVGAVELKGLPEPVLVHEVRWEPAADAAPTLPARLTTERSGVFVGRSAERETIEQAWKQTEQGARQVVLLAGEPGIGKTRLATEIAIEAHQRGAVVLFGSCDEDVAVPYQPLVEALRHLVAVCPDDVLAEGLAERGGQLTRLLPELPRRVPGLAAPEAADADAERYLLFSAVADLVAAAGRWRPILMLLDDLHWATKPTLLLLKYLIRSADPMPLLLLGTYRDSDIGRGHPLSELLAEFRRIGGVHRIGLRGLSDAEALALMETLAGHDLEGTELELAHVVHAEADGSPFFMGELLRHFIEAGELVHEQERWTFQGDLALGIPDSVREVIGHRISRLPEPLDRLLTLGAVIGQEFDAGVLAVVTNLERAVVIEALSEARRAAVVREVKSSSGRFAFAHALIRHTLYDELGPARRMEAHRLVAEALEKFAGTGENLAELAHHWLAATPAAGVQPTETAKAAGYAERAGRQAMDSLAYEEAVHHFEGALRAARQGTDQTVVCELLIALGEAQRCAGDPAHRETLLEAGRLAQVHGDPERAGRAALANQRGLFSRLLSVDPDKVAALEAALELAGSTATAARARLLAALSTELQWQEDERRLELAREAVATARRVDDQATLGQTLAVLWFAAWGSLPPAQRAPLADELDELATRLDDRTLGFLAGIAICVSASEAGNPERADAGLARCRRLAEELDQPALRWWEAWVRGHRLMAAGRFDEAEGYAEEVLRLGETAGQPDALFPSETHFMCVRMLQGRIEEATTSCERVLGQYPGAVPYQALLAWAHAEAGRLDEAEAILASLRVDGFASVPRGYTRVVVLSVLSRACALLEDTAGAEELYRLLFPHRSAMAMVQSAWLGPVTHHLGLLCTVLGRYDDADAHFADALEFQERASAWGTLVHTQLEWARTLLRRAQSGDLEQARRLLTAAQAGARELELTGLEPRIAALADEASRQDL